ncbi:helix-turn-helix domain-containing protein [Mumia sp. zg.B53]|uniref:helix-turn-helix domain-containing protein n=1 Tax=Mumia sp. zg.B53 TaxID=2855449 RepID=UPI001C6E5946|nr:helix-turn-helix domain-containing protein [Mumia sp. zg.B53]MBW9215733.1 helix-turn-helix domain-containing protein [Mumia sp. zg.B53]
MSETYRPVAPEPVRNVDPLLTVPEAAVYLRVSVAFVRRRIRQGVIPVVRVGSRNQRVQRSALDRYLQEAADQ